jgi:ArsR family transcriptional regulator
VKTHPQKKSRGAAARAQMSDGALELIAARFRALGEPSRLKLLIALEAGDRNVSELVAATGLTQANVSRHLQTLTAEGILSRRKGGLAVFYQIADPTIFNLCEHVCGSLQTRLAAQAGVFGG